MSNFSGAGVPDAPERVGKLIKPGVTQGVIASVEFVESSQNKTKGIELVIMTKPVAGLKDKDDKDGPDIGQKATVRWWMSAKAWDNNGEMDMWTTKARLSVISDKIGCRAEYDAIVADSEKGFVEKVAPLFKGKKARWAFGGEERSFENDKGETITFIQPDLLTFKFVESTEEIPNDDDTKLVYDETNKHHFKKAEVADSASADTATGTTTDEVSW